jgi:hypothetical protein
MLAQGTSVGGRRFENGGWSLKSKNGRRPVLGRSVERDYGRALHLVQPAVNEQDEDAGVERDGHGWSEEEEER